MMSSWENYDSSFTLAAACEKHSLRFDPKKGCSSYFISSSPVYHLLTEDQPSTSRALTRYCIFQLHLLVLVSLILSRFQVPGSSFIP